MQNPLLSSGLYYYYIIMNASKNTIIKIAGGIVMLAVMLAGFWYLSGRQSLSTQDQGAGPTGATGGNGSAAVAGPSTIIYAKPSSNPIKNELPETNPFGNKINPFQGVYKNPFAR